MNNEPITFEQVRSSLGGLLLVWSALERDTRKILAQLNGGTLSKMPHGASALFNDWQAKVTKVESSSPFRALLIRRLRLQLQEALEIRNGLCHGLMGYNASLGDQPARLGWELDDGPRSITYHEMVDMLGWLSRINRALSLLTRAPNGGPGCRLIDTAENRGWWAEEFGLRLEGP